MKRSLRIILALLTGVLLSLAWLGFPGWIMFIGFLPLLLLDDFFVAEKAAFRSVSFFGQAFLAFVTWNIMATWWVMHASLPGAIAAILLNSFFMSLTWWLGHIARRKFSGNLGYVALIAFYLSFEFLHYHWDIEWPWLTLGNGFADNVKLIQWYEFTGVFGGSLWVLVVNILLYKLLKSIVQKQYDRYFYLTVSGLLLLVFIPVIISGNLYKNYHEKSDPREVVVVQPNIDPYNESHELGFSNSVLDKFLNLASLEITNETDFVVGPETIFEQYWDEENLERNAQYRKISSFAESHPGMGLLFGASTLKYYLPGDTIPVTAREREISGGRKVVFDIFNTAIYTEQNNEPQIYHKSILVSGVEKMPYIKYLGFLRNFVIDLGGSSGSLGRQKEPANFHASDGTVIAPAICYESIFGAYISEFVKKGAQFIFIITNDGWWKDTPGYKQHMSYARLRAIENRRSIARSANTGISCFINQRGDVFQKTQWWADAVIRGQINANSELTFYTRFGDYIPRISSFLSVLLLLYMLALKIRGKQNPVS